MSSTLILYYRRIGRYALNTLAGALGCDSATAHIPVLFPTSRAELLAQMAAALAAGDQVVVGWSFFSPELSAIRSEIEAVRARLSDPRLLHLAGGVHASAEPEETLRLGFDLVAVGEGERIIIDLMRAIDRGEDPRAVAGIAHLRDGVAVRRGRGELIDLDAFPCGSARHGKFGPIEITRGCLYACRFCQTPFLTKARFRHRGIASVREQVRAMRRLGFRDYRFLTPTALSYGTADASVNLAAIEALLAAAREEAGAASRIWFGTFPSEVRPEHVSAGALALIRRYCDNDNLIIGAQSGAQAVLDRTRRGHDLESVERAVRLTVEAGLTPNVDFLFGLPGESEEEMHASAAFAERLALLGARIHCHAFMPLPGTPLGGEPPAPIPPSVALALERLATRGEAYGPWQRQAEMGRAMVRTRRPRR